MTIKDIAITTENITINLRQINTIHNKLITKKLEDIKEVYLRLTPEVTELLAAVEGSTIASYAKAGINEGINKLLVKKYPRYIALKNSYRVTPTRHVIENMVRKGLTEKEIINQLIA